MNDLRNGQGRMNYHDGSLYEGSWAIGNPHGQGKRFTADGETFEGEFRHGELIQSSAMLTYGKQKFERCVFTIDQNVPRTFAKKEDQQNDFLDAHTLMVGQALVSFKCGDIVEVCKYENFVGSSEIDKTEMQPLHQSLYNFSISLIKNRFILLTGGSYSQGVEQCSENAFLFDTKIGTWVSERTHPCLQQARSFHSSCANSFFAFVFGGWIPGQFLDSFEKISVMQQ